jgi:hypothetical protein
VLYRVAPSRKDARWQWLSWGSVAEPELQTRRDTTVGPPQPLGERGAYVADHVAESPDDPA